MKKLVALIGMLSVITISLIGCDSGISLEDYNSYDIGDFASLHIPVDWEMGEAVSVVYNYFEGEQSECELAFYDDYIVSAEGGYFAIFNKADSEILLYDLGAEISIIEERKISVDLKLYPEFDFSEDTQILEPFGDNINSFNMVFRGEERFEHSLSGESLDSSDIVKANMPITVFEDTVLVEYGGEDIEINLSEVYSGELTNELYSEVSDFLFWGATAVSSDIVVLTVLPKALFGVVDNPNFTALDIDFYYNLATDEVLYYKAGDYTVYPLVGGLLYLSNTSADSEFISFVDNRINIETLSAEDGFFSKNVIINSEGSLIAVNSNNEFIDIYDCRDGLVFLERISLAHLGLNDKSFNFEIDCRFDENGDIVVDFMETQEVVFAGL